LLRFPILGGTDTLSAIWKAGDDLTTDELVLTLGEGMNRIWASSGCDARIVSYRVRPTGLRVGAIEMVPGCTSLGKIQGNWKVRA
jgi:phosphatidylinositol kinase/protein kinase (PI-3  family)